MSFRKRNYPEVLDNLLTELIGGVAAESHPFPPMEGSQSHHLEKPPVKKLISVHGVRHNESQTFRESVDFRLEADQQTLTWISDGNTPDPGTLIQVNYLREGTKPTLTDLQVGSVTRTLTESMALEISRLHAQLEAVYDAGFVDSASGSALDKVVSLLDIRRLQGTRPSTSLRFSRSEGARGSITIPAGTRVLDDQVQYEYETTETVTMAENQTSISVNARDLEPGNEPVPAKVLTVLSIPLAGINGVTNPGPARRANNDESDDELRTRAKNFLHGSERATEGALRQVLARHQLNADFETVEPGVIEITPHDDNLSPEQLLQLQTELELTRPAGVMVTLTTPLTPLTVDLGLRLTTRDKLVESELKGAHAKVRKLVEAYFSELPARSNASLNQLVGQILSVPQVEDVTIHSAATSSNGTTTNRVEPEAGIINLAGEPTVLGNLSIADPNLPSELDLVIRFPAEEAIPEQPKIESALSAMLAYLNELSETTFDPNDSDQLAKRGLTLGKFLWTLPLPGHSAASLSEYDQAPGSLPEPDDILPYHVEVVITQPTSGSKLLADPGTSYQLEPSERLILSSLSIEVEDS